MPDPTQPVKPDPGAIKRIPGGAIQLPWPRLILCVVAGSAVGGFLGGLFVAILCRQ